VQPVLIDGREFMPQTLVEIVDDLWVALHGALRLKDRGWGSRDNLEHF
jgi:hypothetical protein